VAGIKTKFIMNYESFQSQSNKLGNLYNVVRKSDNKEIIRGANYNKVFDIVREKPHLYEIYFY